MNRKPEIIESELPRDLFLGFYRVAYAPVRYRSIEHGDRRYGWTLPAAQRPTAAGTMAPACYALVLVRGGAGEWDVAEMKGFEDVAHAERWARSLAQDAARAESTEGPTSRRPLRPERPEASSAAEDQ